MSVSVSERVLVSVGESESVCVRLVVTRILLNCFSFSSAGGPSMCCERWSNEAATVHADITADHRDVPALM